MLPSLVRIALLHRAESLVTVFFIALISDPLSVNVAQVIGPSIWRLKLSSVWTVWAPDSGGWSFVVSVFSCPVFTNRLHFRRLAVLVNVSANEAHMVRDYGSAQWAVNLPGSVRLCARNLLPNRPCNTSNDAPTLTPNGKIGDYDSPNPIKKWTYPSPGKMMGCRVETETVDSHPCVERVSLSLCHSMPFVR